MEIKLTKGFFIETDEFQFALKQRYTAVSRDGMESENVKTVSYHRTISQAVEKYLKMLHMSMSPDKAVTLREYVNLVTKENKAAKKAIKDLLENKQ